MLHDQILKKYKVVIPINFPGSQRQRISIARAFILNLLMVLGKPTCAIDVSIQTQILDLLNDLQKKYNLSYIFISYDIKVKKQCQIT